MISVGIAFTLNEVSSIPLFPFLSSTLNPITCFPEFIEGLNCRRYVRIPSFKVTDSVLPSIVKVATPSSTISPLALLAFPIISNPSPGLANILLIEISTFNSLVIIKASEVFSKFSTIPLTLTKKRQLPCKLSLVGTFKS